jgi:hypothetical protein
MVVVCFGGDFVLETGKITFIGFAGVAVADCCPDVGYPGTTTGEENVVLLSTSNPETGGGGGGVR